MKIDKILNRNITIVYDKLPLDLIDTTKLKSIFGSSEKLAIIDLPQQLVVINPDGPFVINYGDRRIRLNASEPTEDIEELPLWEIIFTCMEQVIAENLEMIAFGFNFDIGVMIEKPDASDILKTMFLHQEGMVSRYIKGDLLAYIPRLIYERDKVRYDLNFEAVDEIRLKSHLNVHFKIKAHSVPDKAGMKGLFLREFSYFHDMITEIFGAY